MQDLEREDHLHMIKDAQDGKPDELVDRVITTQLEAIQTFKMREERGGGDRGSARPDSQPPNVPSVRRGKQHPRLDHMHYIP